MPGKSDSRGRLTDKFATLIELKWSEFQEIEQDSELDNLTYLVVVLIRACVKGDMRAIRESLDRMDGKVVSEVEVEYPRFYIIFPNATNVVNNNSTATITMGDAAVVSDDDPRGKVADVELPTGSLREVLSRMLDAKVGIVEAILTAVQRRDVDMPEGVGDPLVKSAIVAGLMKLVHKGRVNAVIEVLDQIDGKVKEHIKVLGGDIYVKNFAAIAPEGAEKNENGVYQISSPIVTDTWATRLEGKNKR